jgi:hypothetical protein
MNRFTVTWKPDTQARLAELWNRHPLIRQDITDAADEIDQLLATQPFDIGIEVSERSRKITRPPLTVLYAVSSADRTVRVFHLQLWDE